MRLQKRLCSISLCITGVWVFAVALAFADSAKIDSREGDYGYAEANPIKVGGFAEGRGPSNERKYLNRLRGPDGQRIEYERRGSCCPFETAEAPLGTGLLDMYKITYDGLSEPIILYLNFYDSETLKAPKGFGLADE